MPLPTIVSRHLLPQVLKLLYRSLRISVTMPKHGLPQNGGIVAFWHGNMMVGWLLAKKLFPHKNVAAVVSQSGDGTILADALGTLGFTLIRGSSSTDGDMVKQRMYEHVQQGQMVAITPDGPRGPNHQFKYGTIRLASSQHIPLLFATIGYKRSWQLASWDSFAIPKPFSKVTVTLHILALPLFTSEEELRHFSTTLSACFSHE